nr:PorV/PorQ family protein [uncultured Carboxylicivirga sp.]
MIRTIIVGSIFTFISINIFAQSVSVLSVPVDARSVAMGNTYLTSSQSNGIYSNMAAYAMEDNKLEIGYNYRPWASDLTDGYSFNSFTAAYSAGFKHYFSLGYKSFAEPDFDISDNNGNVTGSYSPGDYTLGLGYAYKLNDVSAVSVTLNYLNSDLSEENSATAFFADLGFKSKFKQLNYGVMVRNLGSKLSYENSEIALPLTFAAGVGYEKVFSENHSLTGQLDAAYLNGDDESGQTVGVGLEYSYKTLVDIRTGYHSSNEEVGLSFYSLGCGVKLAGFHLDFAYLMADNALKNNYSFSIAWKM